MQDAQRQRQLSSEKVASNASSSCSSARRQAAGEREHSMVLSIPPALSSALHVSQVLTATRALYNLAYQGQLLTLAATKLSVVIVFELVNIACTIYLLVSVVFVRRLTNGQLADRALVPIAILMPPWQHLKAWLDPGILAVRQNWWALYACSLIPLGTAYGFTPSYAVFQAVASLLCGVMPCVQSCYTTGKCSMSVAQFLTCILTQSSLTTLANLLAWLLAYSVARSRVRQRAQAALEHSHTLSSIQSRGNSSQLSRALHKQRSSVRTGVSASSREGWTRQSRRSTEHTLGGDVQQRGAVVQVQQPHQQQQQQQQPKAPVAGPQGGFVPLDRAQLQQGTAQGRPSTATQAAGHKAGREAQRVSEHGGGQGADPESQLGHVPLDSFGFSLFPLGLVPKIRDFDVAMTAMVDRIDDAMLVRLMCLPVSVLSIVYALMVRMRMENFSFDNLTADAFFVCIIAWFMLGRDSVTFSLADATEQLRQQVETSLSALAPTGGRSVRELVDSVREQVMNRGGGGRGLRGMPPTDECEDVQVLELLGEGTFGKVHKGMWRGTVVAIKSMVLPSNAGLRRERMAIMEAAISAALSHPNILQTYTYSMQTLKDGSAAQGMASGQAASDAQLASSHGMEVRLVLEYMDRGTLRDALDSGIFINPAGDEVDYEAVLETVSEVAKGMLHLHSLNILHGDLKARNVLLKSSTADSRSFTSKIADFGLSQKMEELETHISSMFQGTPSHMAPEVFMEGTQSKAADVYAFGITLWETYTGKRAFADVARVLLAHHVAESGKRPAFPSGTPRGYVRLAERCWAADPAARPTFQEAAAALAQLKQAFSDGEPEDDSSTQQAHSLKPSGSFSALGSAAPGRSDDLQAQVSPEVRKALSRWAKADAADEWRLAPARPLTRAQPQVQQQERKQEQAPRPQPIQQLGDGVKEAGLHGMQGSGWLQLSATFGSMGQQLRDPTAQPQLGQMPCAPDAHAEQVPEQRTGSHAATPGGPDGSSALGTSLGELHSGIIVTQPSIESIWDAQE